MSIEFEWKIDFPLILTILSVIGSFFYTFFSNRKNKNLNELKSLADIYKNVIQLLKTPGRIRNESFCYTNGDKIVEAIVNRRIKEFDDELDTYWSYYNKKYPELQDLSEEEQKVILEKVDAEYQKAMDERISFKGLILSPAFYCDQVDVYKQLLDMSSYLATNSFIFCKIIRNQIERIIEIDPREIMSKYKTQLEHDSEYFNHNPVLFEDPYRYMLILLRRRYEWLSMSFFERLIEKFRQVRYSKGKDLFRKNKWITTGPII